MNYYFITGSSKGLGKALTELLLSDKNNMVYGFARSKTLQHDHYIHQQIDLSNLDEVEHIQFPSLEDADKIVLVNNAGMVGDVKHVGNVDPASIVTCYNLNLIAPALLTNKFVSVYNSAAAAKLIVNISSGAGRTPIDGWNVYCSTKAGMDMFSQVLHEELKIDGTNFKVLSLAPGIIDTDMQVEIRQADQKEFSNIERFIDYKEQGELTDPRITAEQVLRFIEEDDLSTNVVCSVRDLTN